MAKVHNNFGTSGLHGFREQYKWWKNSNDREWLSFDITKNEILREFVTRFTTSIFLDKCNQSRPLINRLKYFRIGFRFWFVEFMELILIVFGWFCTGERGPGSGQHCLCSRQSRAGVPYYSIQQPGTIPCRISYFAPGWFEDKDE